ncbi:MAG: glycosyltransferase [Bacteroidetes bacterium]|nr:MAG: glycosyltransferase [Bacteroidota bacterium]
MHLHIIAFDIPYPPTYGGVIDVYYKIRALSEAGVKVYLHCFEYGREHAPELESLCQEVHYYPRKTLMASLPLKLPHIVKSRRSQELLDRLQADSHPILFEGLHCCYYLDSTYLAFRQKLVRMHNVEWEYYARLAEREPGFAQRQYLLLESQRLKQFEHKLSHADHILAISPRDTQYFSQHFPSVHYLPAFHPNTRVSSLPGRGSYCLYHAKLSVAENHEAAVFLIREVFALLHIPLIIAGSEPLPELIELISEYDHIKLRHNPGQEEMQELIRQAHINVLPTFQQTGIKLKLLMALFNGRFCLVNEEMVAQTGLETYCVTAFDAGEFRSLVLQLFKFDFPQSEIVKRQQLLDTTFSNQLNAQKIIALLEK